MAVKNNVLLLNRLRRAVKKLKFFLSFSATNWIVSSLARSSSGPRRLSFRTQPSLLDSTAAEYYDAVDCELIVSSSATPGVISRTTSITARPEISRTSSDASSTADDVNQRADRFIENFYRHIQMERQVSLELRYIKENF